MSRRPLIAANWKLHKTRAEVRSFAGAFLAGENVSTTDVLVAPSAPLLDVAVAAFAGSSIVIAGQDASPHPSGAFTGEVSAIQLVDAGCGAVILGHSERRAYHHESDALIRAKLGAALDAGLMPILCVGETLDERESGRTELVVLGELDGALDGLSSERLSRLVVAYEPVWAIGTGRNATPDDAQAVHAAIRARLGMLLDASVAESVRILYGGSVKPDNAAALLERPDIDGALVGGASLDADSFLRIVRASGSRG